MKALVDMLSHAWNKNMNTAVLIAGDRDFRPVVHALIQLGIYVKIACKRSAASGELIWAADALSPLTVSSVWGWCTVEFRKVFQPVMHRDGPCPHHPGSDRLFGSIGDGREVYEMKTEGGWAISFSGVTPRKFHVVHQDRELLRRYAEAEYGTVCWK